MAQQGRTVDSDYLLNQIRAESDEGKTFRVLGIDRQITEAGHVTEFWACNPSRFVN